MSPQHYPTLNFAAFNNQGRVEALYGPWRQSAPSNMTRGQLVAIPPEFSAAYLSGARFGVTTSSGSGIASRPAGCNLAAIEDIDPFTTPPATMPNPPYAEANAHAKNQWILLHDNDHPQARDDRYKLCFWWMPGDPGSQHYDCALNNHIVQGPPVWGGRVQYAGQRGRHASAGPRGSTCRPSTGCCSTASCRRRRTGYIPPGRDPDKLSHTWYGDPSHGSNTRLGVRERQVLPRPGRPLLGRDGRRLALSRAASLAVRHRRARSRRRRARSDPWTLTPSAITQFTDAQGNIALPDVPNQNPSGFFRAPTFDPVSRRLYALCANVDPTSVYGDVKQPVLLGVAGARRGATYRAAHRAAD